MYVCMYVWTIQTKELYFEDALCASCCGHVVFPTWPRPAAEKKLVLQTDSNVSCGLRDPEESPIKPATPQHRRHEQRRFNSVSFLGV